MGCRLSIDQFFEWIFCRGIIRMWPKSNSKICFVTFLIFIWKVCVQNFSPIALKLSEEIEDDGRMYCKNAKFQTALHGTKILLLILAKFPLSLCLKGIKIVSDIFNLLWYCQHRNLLIISPMGYEYQTERVDLFLWTSLLSERCKKMSHFKVWHLIMEKWHLAGDWSAMDCVFESWPLHLQASLDPSLTQNDEAIFLAPVGSHATPSPIMLS